MENNKLKSVSRAVLRQIYFKQKEQLEYELELIHSQANTAFSSSQPFSLCKGNSYNNLYKDVLIGNELKRLLEKCELQSQDEQVKSMRKIYDWFKQQKAKFQVKCQSKEKLDGVTCQNEIKKFSSSPDEDIETERAVEIKKYSMKIKYKQPLTTRNQRERSVFGQVSDHFTSKAKQSEEKLKHSEMLSCDTLSPQQKGVVNRNYSSTKIVTQSDQMPEESPKSMIQSNSQGILSSPYTVRTQTNTTAVPNKSSQVNLSNKSQHLEVKNSDKKFYAQDSINSRLRQQQQHNIQKIRQKNQQLLAYDKVKLDYTKNEIDLKTFESHYFSKPSRNQLVKVFQTYSPRFNEDLAHEVDHEFRLQQELVENDEINKLKDKLSQEEINIPGDILEKALRFDNYQYENFDKKYDASMKELFNEDKYSIPLKVQKKQKRTNSRRLITHQLQERASILKGLQTQRSKSKPFYY